jgi:hypothetical protein
MDEREREVKARSREGNIFPHFPASSQTRGILLYLFFSKTLEMTHQTYSFLTFAPLN